jgi:hypothetical protein
MQVYEAAQLLTQAINLDKGTLRATLAEMTSNLHSVRDDDGNTIGLARYLSVS